MSNEPILLLDSNRGQYIPQNFAEEYAAYGGTWEGITEENRKTLEAGPYEDWYWEAWESVLNNAVLSVTHNGETQRYTLHQDGALWLIPEGYDNEEFFGY